MTACGCVECAWKNRAEEAEALLRALPFENTDDSGFCIYCCRLSPEHDSDCPVAMRDAFLARVEQRG